MTSRNKKKINLSLCHDGFALSRKAAVAVVKNCQVDPLYLRKESIFLHFSAIFEGLLVMRPILFSS